MSLAGRVAAAAVGAAAARVAYDALRRSPLGGNDTWERTNHRGEAVTLLEGPAFVAGAAAAVALTPGLTAPARLAGVLAATGAGAVGAYDDLAGAGSAKGFHGHLSALRRGEVTSGAVKIAGIGATGLAAAGLITRKPVDTLVGGALIAGAANLVNLLDLRPGRALKVGLLHAPLAVAGGPAGALVAGPLGAGAALLPEDLEERAMLGDAGANALGALIGTALLMRYGRAGRFVHLAGIAALTAASEKVSFSAVIDSTPALRWFDQLGRRTAHLRVVPPIDETPTDGKAQPA
jgi:UDP-GlcNAc:undecaprenyl-phosphate GlcNAc-1-phosphate transferase